MLSCVVFDNDNNSAADSTNWFRDDNPAVLLPSNLRNNTRNGDVVTSVLTIENVTLNDNGTGYFCFPSFGIMSNIGVLSIITGTVLYYVYTLGLSKITVLLYNNYKM